jgi:L-fuconolactonase
MVQDIADDDWLLSPALAPLVAAMARNGLVFDALVLPRHLPRLCTWSTTILTWSSSSIIAASHGSPNTPTSSANRRGAGLADRGSTPALDHVVTCFGPQRMLWGNDWPVVNLAGVMQNGSLPPKPC